MFDHPIYGSQDFLERLHGNLRGWQAARSRRHAMYAQPAAPAASAATMQASAVPRAAPPAPGPTDDLVLLCYQYEQGRPVPVYAHAADLAVASAQASTHPAGDGVPRPEVAPHAASTTGPAGSPPEPAHPGPPASAAPPPDFSEKSVHASAPPRASTSAKHGPTLDLSPPTPPPSIRASEEKAETIERLVVRHRADMEAAEARHIGVVQSLVNQHRHDMEAAEARRITTLEEVLAQHRAAMEAAEERRTAALEGTLAQHRADMDAAETRHAAALEELRQTVSDLRAPQREPVVEQARTDADDAGAFAELRELLAEQASVMKAEHDRTTGAIRDIAEMLAGLGENVSGLVMAIAKPNTPTFGAPPRRDPAQGESSQTAPRQLTTIAPWKIAAPASTAPAATTLAVHTRQAPPAATQTPAPSAENKGPVTAKAPAHAIQEAAPATAPPSQTMADARDPASNTAAPASTTSEAPARPLTVVRNSEPRSGTSPPTVHHAAPAAALSARTRPCVTSLSASIESFFSAAPPVTASASPTPRQRRAEQEARELERLHGSISDDDDSVVPESEDSHG